MFVKTVSTTSGINPVKFDETSGVFYWILNTGSYTVYASTEETFSAGDDGVVSLGPKESRRLETNNDTIYILGEGQVEIHNQRDGICSFKEAPTYSGGGETIDAYTKTESDAKYAEKADVVPYKMGMDFGTCSSAEAVVQKTVTTLTKVAPKPGAVFAIRFDNAVPAQARLTVNGTSGYIQYLGNPIPKGIINAGDVVTFLYYVNTGFNRFEILSVESATDDTEGMIPLNMVAITNEAIGTAPTDYIKPVCAVNTVPNTTGYTSAGIWFVNDTEEDVTAELIAYAENDGVTSIVQMGYGTGKFPGMLENGSGREHFEDVNMSTSPSSYHFTVPSGKTGYFGFNRTTTTSRAIIEKVSVFTDKTFHQNSFVPPNGDVVTTTQTSGNLARYDSSSETVQYVDVKLPSTGMYLIIIDNTNIPEMGAYIAGYAGSYTEVFKMLGRDTYSKVTSSPTSPLAVRIYANNASPIAYHLYKLPFYS